MKKSHNKIEPPIISCDLVASSFGDGMTKFIAYFDPMHAFQHVKSPCGSKRVILQLTIYIKSTTLSPLKLKAEDTDPKIYLNIFKCIFNRYLSSCPVNKIDYYELQFYWLNLGYFGLATVKLTMKLCDRWKFKLLSSYIFLLLIQLRLF